MIQISVIIHLFTLHRNKNWRHSLLLIPHLAIKCRYSHDTMFLLWTHNALQHVMECQKLFLSCPLPYWYYYLYWFQHLTGQELVMSLLICIPFNTIMAMILLHLLIFPKCFSFPHKHSDPNNKLCTSCPISPWEQAELLTSMSLIIIMPFLYCHNYDAIKFNSSVSCPRVYGWHALQRHIVI